MIYEVQITQRAQEDVENVVSYLAGERPSAIRKFLADFENNVSRLYHSPARFPKIRERLRTRRTYRHLLFHRHRIIFRIQRNCAFVLRVLHQGQLLRDLES